MVEREPQHHAPSDRDRGRPVLLDDDGDLADRSDRQHRDLGLDDDRFSPERVLAGCAHHGEGATHQVVGRQVPRGDALVEFPDPTRECAQASDRRRRAPPGTSMPSSATARTRPRFTLRCTTSSSPAKVAFR